MAWLIPSLPPVTKRSGGAPRPSKKPPPKRTIEVQMDWLEDEDAPKSKRRRGPPPLPVSVAKPRRKLPPPLPREDPPEPARRTSVRPRKR